MKRRAMLKSIVLAALGLVGLRKKEELFVVETPDGEIVNSESGRMAAYYWTDNPIEIEPLLPKLISLPPGRWKLHQIVFKKVE